MPQFAVLFDLAAFAIFVAAWVGYGCVVERTGYAPRSVVARLGSYRNIWFACSLAREARMVDMQIMAALQNATALYASISLIALGGALATLRLPDDVISMVSRLPSVAHAAFEAAVAKHPEKRIYRSIRDPIEGARGSGRGLTTSQGCRRVMQA